MAKYIFCGDDALDIINDKKGICVFCLNKLKTALEMS
jgi:hypothetical protein